MGSNSEKGSEDTQNRREKTQSGGEIIDKWEQTEKRGGKKTRNEYAIMDENMLEKGIKSKRIGKLLLTDGNKLDIDRK